MANARHADFLKSVATGSWIPKGQKKTASRLSVSANPVFAPESATLQTQPRRRWALLFLLFGLLATTASIFVLTSMGVTNEISSESSPTPRPLPPTTPASSPPPPVPTSAVVSLTTCRHTVGNQIVILTKNNRCEDGGEDSVASLCDIGTDYPDCPARPVVELKTT